MQEDQKQRLQHLLAQYADNRLTEAEALEMQVMLQEPGVKELMEGMAEAESITDQPGMTLPEADWKRIWDGIQEAKKPVAKTIPIRRRKVWLSAAAVLLLIAAGTTYFVSQKTNEKPVIAAGSFKGDIAAPGINKATLTLANGKKIILDSIGKGSLAFAGAASASKIGDGQLVYNNSTAIVEYHTLANPKGSKPVELELPDGSIAWLNAASSITFPTAFNGSTREISITGEAYFEVTHNAKQPFIVNAGNQQIEDIGTSFNVNAYTDEAGIKTTLVEGSVKINNAVLRPGQQYLSGKVETADLDADLAWKNGLFVFNSVGIETVMRQVARWYDLEVVYEGKKTGDTFGGGITRSASLNQVLEILQSSKVHFRLEGRKLMVLP